MWEDGIAVLCAFENIPSPHIESYKQDYYTQYLPMQQLNFHCQLWETAGFNVQVHVPHPLHL